MAERKIPIMLPIRPHPLRATKRDYEGNSQTPQEMRQSPPKTPPKQFSSILISHSLRMEYLQDKIYSRSLPPPTIYDPTSTPRLPLPSERIFRPGRPTRRIRAWCSYKCKRRILDDNAETEYSHNDFVEDGGDKPHQGVAWLIKTIPVGFSQPPLLVRGGEEENALNDSSIISVGSNEYPSLESESEVSFDEEEYRTSTPNALVPESDEDLNSSQGQSLLYSPIDEKFEDISPLELDILDTMNESMEIFVEDLLDVGHFETVITDSQ